MNTLFRWDTLESRRGMHTLKLVKFTLMFIFKKYFCPNLMLRNQNIKDFPYNLVLFFNV